MSQGCSTPSGLKRSLQFQKISKLSMNFIPLGDAHSWQPCVKAKKSAEKINNFTQRRKWVWDVLHKGAVSPVAEKSFLRITEPVFLRRMSKDPVWIMILVVSGCVDRMVSNISVSSLTDVSVKVRFWVFAILTRVTNQNCVNFIWCGVSQCPQPGGGFGAFPCVLDGPWLSFEAIS